MNYLKIKSISLFASIALMGANAVCKGDSITIPDFSFESFTTNISATGFLSSKSGTIGNWNAQTAGILSGTASIISGTAASFGLPSAPDGSYVTKMTLPGSVGATTDLSQGLAVSFLPSSVYTLSFSVNPLSDATLLANTTLNLKAGGITVASSVLTGLTANIFQTFTLTYTTGVTPPIGSIGIDLNSFSLIGGGGSFYADNFALKVVPVPEPKTYALLAFGLLALVTRWRYPGKIM